MKDADPESLRLHPKLVQERAGQSVITLTMNVYAKIAGKMPLTPEQKTKFDGIAQKALPAALPENSGAAPVKPKAIGAGDEKGEESDSRRPA